VKPVECVICDFGGVLTTPLLDAFAAWQDSSGIPVEALGAAMVAILQREGAHPLYELEMGRLTEQEFLAKLSPDVERVLGRPVQMHDFGPAYFSGLKPNAEMIDLMAELRDRGLRMAMLTNNVREWEPLWRAMLPVDEIFELVVDSGFVGMRKPDPAIYELTLRRLALEAGACLFVDDVQVNCDTARELGLIAVQFNSSAQARAEIEAALAGRQP